MRTSLAFVGLALALGLAACTGMDGTSGSDRMRVTGLEVADGPKVDVRYPAVLTYEADTEVRVVETCFFWSDVTPDTSWLDRRLWFGNGPYCLGPERGAGSGRATTMLVSGYPGTYQLEGYVRYVDGGQSHRSNRVTTEITVTPRY